MKYKGYTIYLDPEEGYYWDNGGFASLDECREDIDWYAAAEAAAYPVEHEDTPALDPPWWITER
jgi:hypothetical protein